MRFTTDNAEETKRLGAALAACLQPGDVVVLNGDLGAGKTQFVQGLAQALGVQTEVTSPTFNILLSYAASLPGGGAGGVKPEGSRSQSIELNHFDLYRLDSVDELEDIAYWEVLEGQGLSFIEWGDKFPEAMPDDYLELSLTAATDGTRTINATPFGPRAQELLLAWKQFL
ncbi:MAG: tRNA (adenosine(37)-N6)-threonylcarbamoyltransferase complex ATPase subunit type 1 TsaE [Eggerthellaceae bacterium]|nr:tRNA (adenosine(37)-N6)-threonylcarbamoyltransferase complex ATPase subunit type 1 TsaE [Eggerthellaceae bacterium]